MFRGVSIDIASPPTAVVRGNVYSPAVHGSLVVTGPGVKVTRAVRDIVAGLTGSGADLTLVEAGREPSRYRSTATELVAALTRARTPHRRHVVLVDGLGELLAAAPDPLWSGEVLALMEGIASASRASACSLVLTGLDPCPGPRVERIAGYCSLLDLSTDVPVLVPSHGGR